MTTDQLSNVLEIGQTTLYDINFAKSFEHFFRKKALSFLECGWKWHQAGLTGRLVQFCSYCF